MRIAYLMHSDRKYDEVVETVNQLTRQGDHIFIMINDDDLREQVQFVYTDYSRVHISYTQGFVREGDISMTRGTLIQVKEAVQIGFGCYINLNDGMMPIKTREEITAFLEEQNGKDFYYMETSEKEEPALRRKTLKYYPFTNLLAFPRGRATRAITRGFGSLLYALRIRRALDDVIQIGSPWFMLTHTSAQILADSFDYHFTILKLSRCAEEIHVPVMLDKSGSKCVEYVNNDYHIVGNGRWEHSRNTHPTAREAIDRNPGALFAGVILIDEDFALYEKYFDIYNANLETEE